MNSIALPVASSSCCSSVAPSGLAVAAGVEGGAVLAVGESVGAAVGATVGDAVGAAVPAGVGEASGLRGGGSS